MARNASPTYSFSQEKVKQMLKLNEGIAGLFTERAYLLMLFSQA